MRLFLFNFFICAIGITMVNAGEVTDLMLFDAATNQQIRVLEDGETIDLSSTDRGVNIVAETSGDVESVRFGLNDNNNYRTESVAPFVLQGDNDGNFSEWIPTPGEYTIIATPYSEANAQGEKGESYQITVQVEGKPKQANVGPQEQPSQYEDISSTEEMGEIPPPVGGSATISGDLMRWHEVLLTFEGPNTSETASPNPFLHYRLNVMFTQGDHEYNVPGFYAADGEDGAEGNKWQVRFSPPTTGTWNYEASFRAGYMINTMVNTSLDPEAGKPTAFDGAKGTFSVKKSNKSQPDFRAPENGLLKNRGDHYLTFGGSDRVWIKGGPDIPENFFGYEGFENTPNPNHEFEPHIEDWNEGDPDWGNGKGKGIIGALNYIAENGGNSIYFLPMNIGGDGKDTFPTIGPYEKTRYDSSKLKQWEIVFTHAQSLGIFLHFQLAETEAGNENYHDQGTLGHERKLFYREMVARFGHHNGMEFNIGEENDYGTEKRVRFANFIKAIDPYDHPVAVHTHTNQEKKTYEPILELLKEGEEVGIDMTSFQSRRDGMEMAELAQWFRKQSREAGHPWVISFDEPQVIHNDQDDMEVGYDNARRTKMWPFYMGGGAGFEWYVQLDGGGHGLDHRLEDFSEMKPALNWSKYARKFLYELPLKDIEPMHQLGAAARGTTYVLADSENVYALYNDSCGLGFSIDLTDVDGEFEVKWFDPRNGGKFVTSDVSTVEGGATRNLGDAPYDTDRDWACLVEKIQQIKKTLPCLIYE